MSSGEVEVTIKVTFGNRKCGTIDELVNKFLELMESGGACTCDTEMEYSINQTMGGQPV